MYLQNSHTRMKIKNSKSYKQNLIFSIAFLLMSGVIPERAIAPTPDFLIHTNKIFYNNIILLAPPTS